MVTKIDFFWPSFRTEVVETKQNQKLKVAGNMFCEGFVNNLDISYRRFEFLRMIVEFKNKNRRIYADVAYGSNVGKKHVLLCNYRNKIDFW